MVVFGFFLCACVFDEFENAKMLPASSSCCLTMFLFKLR